MRGVLADASKLVKFSASVHEFAESPLKPEVVLLFDPEGLQPDTVAMIVGRSSVVELSDGRESGWKTYATLPESDRSLMSVAPDGSGFVVVHRTGATSAEPHTFRVIRFDARADTAWAIEIPYDPIRVPGAWRSRHAEERARTEVRGLSEHRVRQAWERAFGRLEFFPAVGGCTGRGRTARPGSSSARAWIRPSGKCWTNPAVPLHASIRRREAG